MGALVCSVAPSAYLHGRGRQCLAGLCVGDDRQAARGRTGEKQGLYPAVKQDDSVSVSAEVPVAGHLAERKHRAESSTQESSSKVSL